MRILIGIALALVLAVAALGWQLRAALTRESEVREAHALAVGALAVSEAQNALLAGRFDALDKALSGLGDALDVNRKDLEHRLDNIANIVQEPGDSDESISCLDVPVAGQLDRSLRR